MSRQKRPIQMTGDHLLKNILLFAYPLILSALFQRLFHAADSVVIGRFSGSNALAAVGSTGPIVELFTWGLMGLSVGADVVVSRLLGSRDKDGVRRAVHTAYCIAIIGGLITLFCGFFLSKIMLILMHVPADILPSAVLYIRIYFIGLFFTVIYNFGAAIVRSSGKTTRPMKYLFITGLQNVILNLFFVLILQLNVAGVALATSISQFTACFLITRSLIREENELKLSLKNLRIDPALAAQMIMIGLPSLCQNALFTTSNIMVQASINTFGAITMAANSAASTIEGFVYISTGAFNQSCVTFTGQNVGARNYRNIYKVLLLALMLTTIGGFTIGFSSYIFGRPLLGLFSTDPAVITDGMVRLKTVAILLFLNALVDVFAASLRGMGYSIVPTLISLTGICGFRLFYIFRIFPAHRSLRTLYLCYPLSWSLTLVVLVIVWLIIYPRFCRKNRYDTI